MSSSIHLRLALTLSLLPALALAQTTTSTTSTAVSLAYPLPIHWAGDLTTSTKSFNASNCNDTLTLQWDYFLGGISGTLSGPMTLWATTASTCESTGPATGDVTYPSVPQAYITGTRTGQFSVSIAALPGFNASDSDGGVSVTCGETGVSLTHLICGLIPYYYGTTTTQNYPATPLTLTYDTKPPTTPTITSTSALDSSATVSISYDSDTVTVSSQYSEADLDGGDVWVDGPTISVANTSKVTLKELTNGTTYDVRIYALDGAGNVSAASDVAQVTPVHTVGFFESLQNGGSTETGGCEVSGSMLVPLAALGLLRALARRSR